MICGFCQGGAVFLVAEHSRRYPVKIACPVCSLKSTANKLAKILIVKREKKGGRK